MKYLKISSLFILAIITMNSCKKDDPPVVNEEEVITTLKYELVPVGGGTTVELSFVDLDGDGGNNPVIMGGTLAENTTYNGTLTLLNESESPAEDITAEILAEDEDHQFFFSVTSGLNASASYSDQDADGNPVGLSSEMVTTTASTGTLQIVLRHEPNKSATGVSAGDITNAGGETDIEVDFPITIQ